MLLLLFERNVSARLQRKINYLLNGGTVQNSFAVGPKTKWLANAIQQQQIMWTPWRKTFRLSAQSAKASKKRTEFIQHKHISHISKSKLIHIFCELAFAR